MSNEDAMPRHKILQSSRTNDVPFVVGVDLGGTQIRTAVLHGATLKSRVGLLTGEDPIPDRIIPRILQSIRQALDEAEISLEHIAGIGIGVPGPLNSRTGVVFAPPNLPGWDKVPLRDIFEGHFNIPIFVENDANAAALGEHMFGAGRGSHDMVYLTISTGIGGGVVVDGKILQGTSGTAAELGHMTIDWRGERCNCGNIGCLESITSGTAIAHRANKMIALGQGNDLLDFALLHQKPQETATPNNSLSTLHVTAHTVAQAAQAGIPLACEIIATAAEALGVGLVNVIHIFNPELIILGGGVSQMGSLLLEPAIRIVEERTMHFPRDAVRIVMAELGADVGLVGAGALVHSSKQNRLS